MSKHTPGPWTHTEFGVSGPTSNGNALLADCHNPLIPTPEMKANARLISTGPRMLEALKASNEALSTLADCWHCDDKVNFLKLLGDNNDAIAEAEGGGGR